MSGEINGNYNANVEFATAKIDLAIVAKNKVENKFTSFFRKIFANKRHEALKSMAKGDFTNRTKIKAFKKDSELAKSLNVYDNGKTTSSLDNKDKLTIDDIKTFVNSGEYASEVKYEKLSKLLFVNGFYKNEDFRSLYAECALAVSNFFCAVRYASAEALLKHIDENSGDADKIFEATIQVGKPFEGLPKKKFLKEYKFNDMVAEYAKERKNYEAFLVFANSAGIYDRCVNDPDVEDIYNVSIELLCKSEQYSAYCMLSFKKLVLRGILINQGKLRE